jgi:DNA modification methylase
VPQIVLDPFCGSGTTGEVCRESLRSFVGLDLSLTYLHENALPRAALTNTQASMATLPMFAQGI